MLMRWPVCPVRHRISRSRSPGGRVPVPGPGPVGLRRRGEVSSWLG
jgi:hypothetical protein